MTSILSPSQNEYTARESMNNTIQHHAKMILNFENMVSLLPRPNANKSALESGEQTGVSNNIVNNIGHTPRVVDKSSQMDSIKTPITSLPEVNRNNH